MERLWSTDLVPPRERLGYWTEAVCDAFLEMKVDSTVPGDFAGHLAQRPLGPIDLNQVRASGQEVWRNRQVIARSRRQNFYLLHIHDHRIRVRQRGRETFAGPGHLVLVDSREPYQFSFPDRVDCLSVQIPPGFLDGYIADAPNATARTIPGGAGFGAALARFLDAVRTTPNPGLSDTTLAEQTATLLSLALGPAETPGNLTLHQRRLLDRLRALLAQGVEDSDFDPAALAAVAGLSRRYLHRLFALAGSSMMTELTDLRLNRAEMLLAAPGAAGLSVSEIAWRCGFADLGQFGRAFRRRHGVSASAWRQGGR
jgi:AraC-like DNA-binding protein